MIRKSMTGVLLIGFVSTLLLFTSACQQKKIIPTPVAVEEPPKVDDSAEQARIAAEQAEKDRLAAEAARLEREKAAAKAAMESEKIYFDYDRADIKPEYQAVLSKKVGWLKDNSSYKLKIEGHCDERGSTEYNMALGARRAEATAKYISAAGVSSDRLTTVSYGEEKPVATGSNEAAWSQNRRAEFVLIQ
ncbi:MAG: peptidoglycan-associated lipoprotein Pal [Desulfatiglans sp.]|jgi:peptidoglycan-associated lipoprotein|nr:peptidoglycan-associated lipoprotein Pal [Desulfatiglans sp.]